MLPISFPCMVDSASEVTITLGGVHSWAGVYSMCFDCWNHGQSKEASSGDCVTYWTVQVRAMYSRPWVKKCPARLICLNFYEQRVHSCTWGSALFMQILFTHFPLCTWVLKPSAIYKHNKTLVESFYGLQAILCCFPFSSLVHLIPSAVLASALGFRRPLERGKSMRETWNNML